MAKLYVGFSRQDMTPRGAAHLGGYGNGDTRISDTVYHPITVTCIAYKDEDGETALTFTQDLCGTSGVHTRKFKELLNEKFGVKKENIFFSAIHSHCAPSEGMSQSQPLMIEWNETKYYPAVMKAAEEALKDLDEAEIYAGKDEIYGMNYVRRYINSEGKFLGNFIKEGIEDAMHESEPDRNVQVIRFKRKNNRDIILVNFQSHPSGFFDGLEAKIVSSDYPYYIRTVVGARENADVAFFQGAAGNLVFSSRLKGEAFYGKWNKLQACEYYGTTIADKVVEILSKMTKLEAGKIRTCQKDVELTVDHTLDDKAEISKKIYQIFSEGKTEEATALCKENGISSYYYARDIYVKSTLPATKTIPVWAMNIGEFGFGYAPYEMFDTNGMDVKNASPCKMTFICELSNDGNSYMPSRIAYSHGGYEVQSCKYVEGCAEQLAQGIIDALNENAQNQ